MMLPTLYVDGGGWFRWLIVAGNGAKSVGGEDGFAAPSETRRRLE
jgi:hypothetical protein